MQSRCLIVERHDWETGTKQAQLQFVLSVANKFFGNGNVTKRIKLLVYMEPHSNTPTFRKNCSISKVYNNRTRRLNGFQFMGNIPAAFCFFQETDIANTYDFWWQQDKAIIAARYRGWVQGDNSQYGRGRLSKIVPNLVNKKISRI